MKSSAARDQIETYSTMEEADNKSHVSNPGSKHTAGTRVGSESDLNVEKSPILKQMSVIHKVTFIVTICMAQIFALSGIGQGFGESAEQNT